MSWLVADIGGTNTRCAVGQDEGHLRHIATFRNRDQAGLGPLLKSYVGSLPAPDRPRRAALAVAAPIRGQQVRMINIDWTFSAEGLRSELGLDALELLNDFTALAYALPVLGKGELVQVGGGDAMARATKVVIGPGTGLGAAGLVPVGDQWHAVSGEGGHATLPAADEREAAVIRMAREEFGHCSAERLIAGPGLALLHRILHKEVVTPEQITERAAANDTAAADTLETGFRMLGTVASDLALAFGAYGGVYIGGGVVPRSIERFQNSGFRARFEDKGRYREYLSAIPVFVIVAKYPALAGLVAYASSRRGR